MRSCVIGLKKTQQPFKTRPHMEDVEELVVGHWTCFGRTGLSTHSELFLAAHRWWWSCCSPLADPHWSSHSSVPTSDLGTRRCRVRTCRRSQSHALRAPWLPRFLPPTLAPCNSSSMQHNIKIDSTACWWGTFELDARSRSTGGSSVRGRLQSGVIGRDPSCVSKSNRITWWHLSVFLYSI